MPSDREQTLALRLARTQGKRTIKELNQTGKRLEWVREKLELTQRQVCNGTGIPPSSLCGREAGIRAELVEEFLVLSMFFNRLWIEKFKDSFPFYNDEEVRKISVEWLLFGHDDLETSAPVIIEKYQLKLRDIEEEYLRNEEYLIKQVNMIDYIKELENEETSIRDQE